MHIAIDLQACQQADTKLARDSLAAVLHMVRHPGEHTLWISFSGQLPERIESLRAAFAGLLPCERILTYELPMPDGTVRAQRMAELIRENFFACLGAELVFTPGLSGSGEGTVQPLSPHFLSAIGIAADASPAPALARRAGMLVVEIGAEPARVAQQAFQAFEHALPRVPVAAVPVPRPALVLVAANVPGGTDASAGLIAELARSYALHLVIPEPHAAGDGLQCAIHTLDWFEGNASTFDRIVYILGNSERHHFMPALLARHPGAVVLRDFFLGAVFDGGEQPQVFDKALFDAHGFTGLADARVIGHAATLTKYPLNKTILDLATGILVESDDMVAQAQAWYGPGAGDRWHRVPPLPQAHAATVQPHGGSAHAWADAIEAITQRSPAAHYRALLQALRLNGSPTDARHPELLAAARSIAANQPAVPPRQLLVDVSAMVQLDAKTGISRVVRSILLALIGAPPPGYRVEAVYGDGGNRRYRYARTFTLALIGADDIEVEDAPIEQRPGDLFVGIDVAASITTQNAALLADMRNHGVGVFFLVHDILPVLLPRMFAYGTDTYFRKYLDTITRHADGLLCTTRAGADALAEWIIAHPAPRPAPVRIGYFHLGADLDASAPSTGLPADAARVFAATAQRPTLLIVGTLEPRKAQAQALAAVEQLWSRQIDINLIIVGKSGWMVEPLIKKLKAHPELGARLFWLTEASDEMLTALYGSCSALLAASLGEGFGLPLIEAAQHGLPIIARRLPVFEEICGEHAFYFEGEAAPELADALRAWLALFADGRAPASAGLPWLSWSESARKLLDCVIDQHWYRSLPGTLGGL